MAPRNWLYPSRLPLEMARARTLRGHQEPLTAGGFKSRSILRHPRADCRQFGQSVDRLVRRPADSAQNEQPGQRIVERPSVMSRNRDEYPAFALFARPEERAPGAF